MSLFEISSQKMKSGALTSLTMVGEMPESLLFLQRMSSLRILHPLKRLPFTQLRRFEFSEFPINGKFLLATESLHMMFDVDLRDHYNLNTYLDNI